METLGTQYAEAMISSLNFTLGRTSSAIVDRREVKIKPRGSNVYSPGGQKTIEFSIVDGASYLLANTLKLQFRIRNGGQGVEPAAGAELEFLGPPHAVCFQSASFKCCGQSVELLEDYGRAYLAMEQLLPQASRAMNGAETLPLLDTAPAPTDGNWGFLGTLADATTAAAQPLHRRNQDIISKQPDDAAYRSAILRSDKYRPVSGVLGKREELVLSLIHI